MNEPAPGDDDAARLAHAARYTSAGRSRRRLTPARRLLYRVAAALAWMLIRLWWWSCRVRVVDGARLDAAIAAHGAVIPVYWHQHQLFAVKPLIERSARGLKLGFLISPSVDGEIGVLLVERIGAQAIRGSSSHTGAKALRDYYVAMTKQGLSPIISPDGPRGPRHEFKPGAILLSQLSGRPIVPIAFAAARAYRFRTWDRFVLPWPFTRVVIAIGAPCIVPKGQDEVTLERWQREMGAALQGLYVHAREALRTPGR